MPLYAFELCLFAVSRDDAQRAFEALNAKLGPVRGFNTISEDYGNPFHIGLEAVELDVATAEAAEAVALAAIEETIGAQGQRPLIAARKYGEHVRSA